MTREMDNGCLELEQFWMTKSQPVAPEVKVAEKEWR